jgi:lipooligosaccharide transport system ATP-binding protein
VDGRLHGLADRVEVLPDRLQLYLADGERALQQVHALGIPLDSAVLRRSTLEDVFLRLTGRRLIE